MTVHAWLSHLTAPELNRNPIAILRSILQALPDSMVVVNAKGVIVLVNDAFLSLSGYTEKELYGKHLSEFLGTKICERIVTQTTEGDKGNYEDLLKTKLGNMRNVIIYSSGIKGRRGHSAGFTNIIQDVTDRRQAESKLAAAERFASLGQFAGMVGHDLRNPLSTVNAAAYYLKNHYSSQMDATGNQMLETIERSIDYSSKMITDLLDYSGEIRLEREVTTLKLVLNKSFTYLNVPSNIKVVDESQGCPQVLLDEAKVCRVLVNLIKNAFDAMPNGGTLTVVTKKTGGNVELTLRDTGVGMAPETLGRLWTPLFTTKAKGLGFGLTICKRIMEAHGGKIQVESQIGQGTSFTLSFPLKSQ